MKKMIQLCFGLMLLCIPLFSGCDDDKGKDDNDDIPLPFYVAPKSDVEFKGACLETVKNAVEGTWWLKKEGDREYQEGTMQYMAIKGDRMITYGGAVVDYAKEPEWRDIIWLESTAEDGSMMHSFFPKFEGYEYGNFVALTPFYIKDNVLVIGYIGGSSELNKHYQLVTKK